MYELDINFLRDRPEYYPNRGSDSKRILPIFQGKLLYFTLASSTLLPVSLAAGWLLLQNQSAQLEKNSGELDAQMLSLDSQLQQAQKVQAETDKVHRDTQTLASVFNRLRPWSAILQDLGDRIPQAVQIETVKQLAPTTTQLDQPAQNPTGGIEISGIASSFNDVNDFLITLQQSALFKPADIKIVTAELIDSPIPVVGGVSRTAKSEVIKPPQVVQYTIQASLSDTPATGLIQELEHDGAIGLIARIRALQLKGEPTRKALPHAFIQKSDSPSAGRTDLRISRSINKPERQRITLRNSALALNKSLRKSISVPKKETSEKAVSAYPTAFGITLTPAFISALIATLGTTGFLYFLLRKVMPVGKKRRNAMEYQMQVIPELSKEAEIELTQAEHRLAQLPPSMPNRESFDMLMLDLYQMIKSGTKLTRFVLSEQPAEAITNSSREPLSNGELKLQVVSIGFEATDEQTKLILGDIERLQPLLIVKDYQSTLATATPDSNGKVTRDPTIINTSFQLQAIMPVSSEETAVAIGNGNNKK